MKNKKIIKLLLIPIVLAAVLILSLNFYVVGSQRNKIIPEETVSHLDDADYIMVLGCGIKGDEPSDMLYDRLIKAVGILKKCDDKKVILSGDNSGAEYNEVGVMHRFMLNHGISEERIIDDNTGFSTGESMENFKNVFVGESLVVITQPFHLYRALFIAEALGFEAYGVEAAENRYAHEYYYSFREILARNKDFVKYTLYDFI